MEWGQITIFFPYHRCLRFMWKSFERAWINYALATGLESKTKGSQFATLHVLTVMGKVACEVIATCSREDAGNKDSYLHCQHLFERYCQPHCNITVRKVSF